MEPRQILKMCKKFGFDTVSITDHDSIKGSVAAKKYEKEFGIKVFIGEERKTDCGDIIGVDLSEEIKSKNCMEVIEEIEDQGGISILPHPFRDHINIENVARRVDVIEIFNSRNIVGANDEALDLALRYNKPSVTGSDAHVYSEIGNSIMDFDDTFTCHEYITTNYSTKKQMVESYLVKDIKLHKYYKIPIHIMRLVF